MKVSLEPVEWIDKNYATMMNYSYRDQFKPEAFRNILNAYRLFLPLLFKKLDLDRNTLHLVGRGLSGTVFVLPLAMKLKTQATIVRKKTESSHSETNLEYSDSEGPRGAPWIFIDDCISSGATRDACIDAIGSEPVAIVLWGTQGFGKPYRGLYLLSQHVSMED